MEYEKHIKRLVLGYLKCECKSAYKIFLRNNFQTQQKHIATRVAGQTLEDILRIYSRVQDIVQGRLEETDYYRENGADVSSPVYLAEQLLYLLEKDRPFTPVSTICERSPEASSIAETHHENEDIVGHISDIETTPEHTLPGNIPSHVDNYISKTPFRRKSGSPVFRTPFLGTSEQNNISSFQVMSAKLLKKREFHEKLAQNINTALNTPELSGPSRKCEHDVDKTKVSVELEDTIKTVISRTEADPMFDDLIADFLDPTYHSKVDNAISAHITARSSCSNSMTPSNNLPNVEDHNNGAVSSILAISDVTSHSKSNFEDPSINNAVQNENVTHPPTPVPPSEQLTGEVTPSGQLSDKATSSEQVGGKVGTSDQTGHVQQCFAASLENHQIIHTPSGVYALPSSAVSQSGSQQQQFYIVNQPLMIPQTNQVMQLIQPVHSVNKPVVLDTSQKLLPKINNSNLTEQDIMAMPTIIVNERNVVTYSDDPDILPVNTPFKLNEVRNIKEYFNVFGSTDQSPIIKKNTQKRSKAAIKPTPTIKVEIFQRNSPIPDMEDKSSTNVSNPVKELPNLSGDVEIVPDNHSEEHLNKETSKSTPNENKIPSNDDSKPRSLNSVCTPSPLVTAVKKPTPKSSSHVRNLAFPSPLRKTSSEKPDANQNSPSTLNKKHATKDLFKNTSGGDPEIVTQSKRSLKRKSKTNTTTKKSEQQKLKSPKETKSPKKTNSPKKTKSLKKNVKKDSNKTVEHKTPESWDALLRKNLPPVSNNQSTPVRRTPARKRIRRSTELDVSDPDGKKLEEALKTPAKSEKLKPKTPSNKRGAKADKPKPEKQLPQVEEEANPETTKILSPSKLCNTASKRNMEVDGITPNVAKEVLHQPVSNARKNITSLLETPLKDDGLTSSTGVTLHPTDAPFTPMLKANLVDFTDGDTFSINTPNFPVTPGLSLMEHSSEAYYILNDTETNKATEAIILSEERKSSVRKTDDEDFQMSPKVYGCKEFMDEFNKTRAGQKNLELLDNRGVTWDGSSDKEDKTDNSESNSDGESNNTVIQNLNQPQTISCVSQNTRSAKKSMTVLKSRLVDKSKDPNGHFDTALEISTREDMTANSEDHGSKHESNQCKVNQPNLCQQKTTSSSSDSEIICKKSYKSKDKKGINIKENENDNSCDDNNSKKNRAYEAGKTKTEDTCECSKSENHNVGECNNKKDLICRRVDKGKLISKKSTGHMSEYAEEQLCLKKDTNIDISSVTRESIKQAVSTVSLENCTSHIRTAYSLKEEMDEKRKRVIALEKAKESQTFKTPNRRRSMKPQPNLHSSSSKRKRLQPKKWVPNLESNEEEGEINIELEKVDSQDDFFKKSGSNLHRTNKHIVENNSENALDLNPTESNIVIIESNQSKTESELKALGDSTCKIKTVGIGNSEPIEGQESTQEIDKSTDTELDNANGSFWNECVLELQPEAKVIVYDRLNTSKKSLEDYDLKLEKKGFKMLVPLTDGTTQTVQLHVTPFKELWEIKPSTSRSDNGGDATTMSSAAVIKPTPDCNSDSENASCKVGDPDELKCPKKRKHRSDSCNSNSSSKKMKTSLIPNFLNENNIEKLLTKLHGPSEKT